MGYYVRGTGTVTIRTADVDNAYKALCALNDSDELKRGGRWGGPDGSENPRPAGLNYHPARWFSWMDANYPDTCPNLVAILVMLGFDVRERDADADTLLLDLSYDNKTGQEELFTQALAPFIVSGELYWDGEDGTKWREVFANGSHKVQGASVVYGDDYDIRPV